MYGVSVTSDSALTDCAPVGVAMSGTAASAELLNEFRIEAEGLLARLDKAVSDRNYENFSDLALALRASAVNVGTNFFSSA